MRMIEAIRQSVGTIWADDMRWRGNYVTMHRTIPPLASTSKFFDAYTVEMWWDKLALIAKNEFPNVLDEIRLVSVGSTRQADGLYRMQAVFALIWK